LVDLVWTEDIRIIADPLDCNPSLADAGFVYSLDVLGSATPGTHVVYQTGAPDELITTTFTNVFTHTLTVDCPVSSCVLEEATCNGNPFSIADVSIAGTGPYAI